MVGSNEKKMRSPLMHNSKESDTAVRFLPKKTEEL